MSSYIGSGLFKQMWQSIVNAISFIFGGDQSAVDEATGLTNQQKTLIKSSWELAYKNKKHFGVQLFIRLFRKSTETQDLFEKLRGLSEEELLTSSKMKAHALRVMASLNSCVENIDDIEILKELLINIARSHYRHQVERPAYDTLGVVLMETMEAELKDKFSPKAKEAWLKAYGVMTSVICGEYDDIEGNDNIIKE